MCQITINIVRISSNTEKLLQCHICFFIFSVKSSYAYHTVSYVENNFLGCVMDMKIYFESLGLD